MEYFLLIPFEVPHILQTIFCLTSPSPVLSYYSFLSFDCLTQSALHLSSLNFVLLISDQFSKLKALLYGGSGLPCTLPSHTYSISVHIINRKYQKEPGPRWTFDVISLKKSLSKLIDHWEQLYMCTLSIS